MQTDTIISFPGLGIDGVNPSRYFTVFGKPIYWYGVIIALGMIIALIYAMKRSKQFGLKSDTLLDIFIWGIPSAIVFARLYYVLFYQDASGVNPYFEEPIKMLYIWEGGLAIYGGVFGAVLAAFIYTRVTKKKLLPILDLVCLGLLIGQCIGRWGNFINREAYGDFVSETYLLRMGLTVVNSTVYVHPTFLYESLWNLVGFIVLHFVSKKRKYDGQMLLMYLGWYGLGRLWIEGLRTDSLFIGTTSIRVSQLIAGISFIFAVTVLAYIRFIAKPSSERMLVNSDRSEIKEPTEDEANKENNDCFYAAAETVADEIAESDTFACDSAEDNSDSVKTNADDNRE